MIVIYPLGSRRGGTIAVDEAGPPEGKAPVAGTGRKAGKRTPHEPSYVSPAAIALFPLPRHRRTMPPRRSRGRNPQIIKFCAQHERHCSAHTTAPNGGDARLI